MMEYFICHSQCYKLYYYLLTESRHSKANNKSLSLQSKPLKYPTLKKYF